MTEFAAGEFYGDVGTKVCGSGAVFSHLSHGRGRRLPAHAHNAAFFSLLLRGGYRERFRRGEIDYRPLTIVFHSPGLLHEDEIATGGAAFFMMEFDASFWNEAGFRFPDSPFGSEHPDLLGLALALLSRQRSGTLEALDIENAAIEMLGEALRVPLRKEHGDQPWLVEVVDRIEAAYSDALSVNDLAAIAGVHPVHLSRVFRKRFGMLISEYVRRKRISASIRRLRNPDLAIGDIGHACGFSDHAHFCRVFRASTGLTPGSARRILLAS